MVIIRRYFTLIELLVVIAIIAILAGMLLPALGKVKETGRRTECLNRIKQHGLLYFSYCDDYNGFLPTSHKKPGDANFGYAGYSLPNEWSTGKVGGNGLGQFLKLLCQYSRPPLLASYNAVIPRSSVIYCPSSKTDMKNAGAISQYALNMMFADGFGSTEGPKAPAKAPYPARAMIVGESGGSDYLLHYCDTRSSQGPAFRHDGSSNYFFADGHVANWKECNTPSTKNPYEPTFYAYNIHTLFWGYKTTPSSGRFAGL